MKSNINPNFITLLKVAAFVVGMYALMYVICFLLVNFA